MNSKTNNIKAFPLQEINHTYIYEPATTGMDLRDYFAAKAMQSLITNMEFYSGKDREEISKLSYEIADVMIVTRMQ